MAIKHLKDIPFSTLSTFRLGGSAREVVILESEADIEEFFKNLSPDQKFFILGGGSNVVFPDGDTDTTIVQYISNNIKIIKEDSESAEIIVDAGMAWDEFVAFAVSKGLSGIEALSAIPGTVGATPIQNVGAYGTEVKNTIVSLQAYDYMDHKFVTLSNAECAFGYRDSIFKHSAKNRYLVTAITFRLSKKPAQIPAYLGVAEYFTANNLAQPTLADIRNAIIAIRANKLPDPKEIASCGSFFKNPIVSHSKGLELKETFPTLAVFPVDDTHTKIGAGSLIDTLGWKGKRIGNFSFYNGNAMVIVHEGGGTRNELSEVIATLNKELETKYGIVLEPEPELLAF